MPKAQAAARKRRTRIARKRTIRYAGNRWDVMQDRGKYLIIGRGRGGYSMFLDASLATSPQGDMDYGRED